MTLRDEINTFVEDTLSIGQIEQHEQPKILRDGIGNLITFENYEISIIDSPLLQRLRNIHQTAFAYLVYPSANHTRFEHSLGVANIVKQITTSLHSHRQEATVRLH